MNRDEKKIDSWREWISPLKLSLLVINAICFGGCIVLLATGASSGTLVILTIATGLSFGAGFVGAMIASQKYKSSSE